MRYLLGLALPLVLLACGEDRPSAGFVSETGGARVELLRHHVQLTGGARPEDTLPLIVTLHGRSGTPAHFTRFFTDLDVPARLLHLEAPVEEGDGRAWFTFRFKTPDMLAEETRLLARRAVATTRRFMETHPTRGQPVVTGFSQGAMIVYLIALEHPDAFAEAFPVAGLLVTDYGIGPDSLAHLPPIVAFHGEDDPIMSVASERRTIATLRSRGARAELRTYPNVAHWIQRGLKDDLHRELTRAVCGE